MKSICITPAGIINVPDLASCQEECDTRIVLHAIYSVQKLGVKRVVVHGNDTDIVVLLVYYASTLMSGIELWVRKSSDQWIPVHELATKSR